jgi:hypothetical protein
MSHIAAARPSLMAVIRPWILAALAVLALAMVVRFLVIEPRGIGIACLSAPVPWWCGPRDVVVAISRRGGWGMAALLAGILALITGWRPLAMTAFALGLWGIVLYNAGAAAFGLIFGLLKLVRR